MKAVFRILSPYIFGASLATITLVIVWFSLYRTDLGFEPATTFVLLALILVSSLSFLHTAHVLQKERAERAEIIEKLSDGIIVTNRNGVVLLMNSRAREMLFLTKDPTGRLIIPQLKEEKNLGLLPPLFFPPNTPEGIFRTIQQAREYHFSEPLELYLRVDSTLLPEKDHRRQPTRVLLLLHDLTREKVLSKLKSEFISIAAHQLRTPLSAIKWTLRLILDGDLGPVTTEQRDYMRATYQTNERMIKLVNDLLNVTRIEEGRFEYFFEDHDIAALVEATVLSLKEIAAHKNVALIFEKPKKLLPPTSCDRDKIQMVLQNLIENAIHYTPPNGKIAVTVQDEGTGISVAVSDTGIGIAPKDRARLFSKFFRSEEAIRTTPDGTGLGLFIARNIVLRHGGTIEVESEIGKGSTFRFHLPRSRPTFATFRANRAVSTPEKTP